MGPHQGNFTDYGAEPVKGAREWEKGSWTRVNSEIVGRRVSLVRAAEIEI